jgi:hypothetical protein
MVQRRMERRAVLMFSSMGEERRSADTQSGEAKSGEAQLPVRA